MDMPAPQITCAHPDLPLDLARVDVLSDKLDMAKDMPLRMIELERGYPSIHDHVNRKPT